MQSWENEKHATYLPRDSEICPSTFLCAQVRGRSLRDRPLNPESPRPEYGNGRFLLWKISKLSDVPNHSQIFLVYPRSVQVAPFRSETCCCREVSSCFGYPDSVEDTVCFSAKQGSHLLYRSRFAKLRLGNFVSQPARELRSIEKAGTQRHTIVTLHIYCIKRSTLTTWKNKDSGVQG